MGNTIKIARCGRCGDTYVKIRFPVCDGCLDEEDADYQRISDVLSENENLNVEIVSGLAGVTTACVLRMLDRGLIANEVESEDIKCGQCGAPAISAAKRLCHRCLIRLDQKFFSQINEAKKVREIQERDKTVHETLNSKRKNLLKPKKQ